MVGVVVLLASSGLVGAFAGKIRSVGEPSTVYFGSGNVIRDASGNGATHRDTTNAAPIPAILVR